jgi:hypothetical protein
LIRLLTKSENGAAWAPHWAFVAPVALEPPPVLDESWPRDEIDAFVLARLEADGIGPSPEADPLRLLRRVTLDLTGLPPTLAEIDAFCADDPATAYERAVDRLLASTRFGERMAVPWLDVARYADSYGYQSDLLSPTWPYRDWVIRAFNDNLPFDAFITHQLAGDLLPRPTRDQVLATAFNRLHRMTNEGGSIESEFRTEYAADRAHTFGTAFLALTFECARCHDHKFDPLSMREYYELLAFFNSIDEWGMYHDSSRVPTPSLLLPTPEQERVLADRAGDLRRAEEALDDAIRRAEPAFLDWLPEAPVTVPAPPGLVGRYPLDAIGPDGRLANTIDEANAGSTPGTNSLVEGVTGQALRFTGDDAASFPRIAGALEPWQPFTVAFQLRLPGGLDDCIIFHRSGGTDVGRFGTELALREGRLFLGTIRFWPGNAIAIETIDRVPADTWMHVTARSEATGSAAGLAIFIDGEPARTRIVADRLVHDPGAGGHGITFGARFRDSGLAGGAIDELHVFDRALATIEVRHLHDRTALDEALAARDATALRPYYDAAIDETVAAARAARGAALRGLLAARNGVAEIMVMEETPTPRETFVLARGEYDAPTTDADRVQRQVPAILPPLPDGPRDRLALARWLIEPEHPLTARVAVNRFWQVFFGRGLVSTSENFGLQGGVPSHPALLDRLAVDFVDSGWDVKALCRRIVTSATYRQASTTRPGLAAIDPENALLARGPSGRLPAEMIRDLALSASGLLEETMYGPPVSPYQPAGLWRESNSMSPAYRQSVGTALHRRSLYTIWKRTAPIPNMLVFDAATREVCTVRRATTNTPLQAFVLLNDPQFVEAARVLAERMLAEGGDDDADRVTFAFRLLTGRPPAPPERALLVALYAEQRDVFAADPDAPGRFLAVGEHPVDPALDPVETAAATVVAQTILNLDATVWKR